jgi:hypothetical protein
MFLKIGADSVAVTTYQLPFVFYQVLENRELTAKFV